MSDGDASYVEAKVRIDSGSVLSSGAWGVIRIKGYFYNESRGPGSGLDHNEFQGDVYADVRLQWFDNGSLGARAYVGRSDSDDENEWSDLSNHDFLTPITFDTDYTLSIEYTGNQLIFKCNGESYTYTIATPQYPAFGEHRQIRSRVYLDPGEYGYIKAMVDDVYVDSEYTTGGQNSKVDIAANGWANIAFNHVTVDGVDLSSAHNYSGLADHTGTATLDGRLLEHQYNDVSLQ